MNGKLVLVDGHSILHRAYHGIPPLSTSTGVPTNAVYGFLNILLKFLDEEKPDYLAVAFDTHAPTFRHEMFADYKGTRKPMPEDLRPQVPLMKQMLQAMGIVTVEQAGLEADDILGTLARKGEREGLEVSLISGDRDLLQVATDHIRIRIPKNLSGKTVVEDYYAADVAARYQVTPTQFIDVKALMGDTADNIPGVPKVGDKTATELIVTYGSLDGVYAHVSEISKKSVRESLEENRELAYLSKDLATIRLDSDFPFSFDDAKMGNIYTEEAYLLCKQLEFQKLLPQFGKNAVSHADMSGHFQTVKTKEEAEAVFEKAEVLCCAESGHIFGLALLADGRTAADCVGLSFALSEEEVYFFDATAGISAEYLGEQRRALLAETDCRFCVCWLKELHGILEDNIVKSYKNRRYFDILIAAYLLNPLQEEPSPEIVASAYAGMVLPDVKEVCGKSSFREMAGFKPDALRDFACFRALTCVKTEQTLAEQLSAQGMESLFYDIELPLTSVLHEMEYWGIRVERDKLAVYGQELAERITVLEQSIYDQAGTPFNINSPKQLGEILFERLHMPGGKKTKTGYSTAADVLEKLAGDYPIVRDILEYRGLTKLKSTYADGLAGWIDDGGRIHSTFHQTMTATGRISSADPNLQNIPMRTQLGREIRRVFVPDEGFLFMDADYSQIELRVLAHMSGDENLIAAYKTGQDIHRITASQVFHVPFEEVTDTQRRNAKAVNFGIIYGISSFGLSQDLSISRKEAADYIEQYFATFPGIRQFLDGLVSSAKEKGYSTTLFGRKRPIPELNADQFLGRSFGERVAMNAPIQGTAADIIKIAMIHVWERMKRENLSSRLILQVHDELLIETAPGEEEAVRKILTEEMQQAADLSVALEIDLHTGETWYDAK